MTVQGPIIVFGIGNVSHYKISVLLATSLWMDFAPLGSWWQALASGTYTLD